MAKLEWDKTGEHLFECGVDHGVLFPMNDDGTYGTGVAWNGLTNVNESPEGAEPTDIFADNIKYLSIMSAETFGATIEAYTYPEEFAECDGSARIGSAGGGAMYIGQQKRRGFAFAYRTRIGNDVVGDDLGYKIHIVYGCMASPSEKSNSTVNDSPEAATFSWTVKSTPVDVPGTDKYGKPYRPTSHIYFDSTKTESQRMTAILNKLWGTDDADPELPMPAYLIDAMTAQMNGGHSGNGPNG